MWPVSIEVSISGFHPEDAGALPARAIDDGGRIGYTKKVWARSISSDAIDF